MLLFIHAAMSDSLRPHGQQRCRPPRPLPSPGVCSISCPLSWWCYPNILSSFVPFFFFLQSFPASGSFPMSQLYTSGEQNIGASASASVFPMNIQGWVSLGLTGFDFLAVQGTVKSLLQHHNSKAPILYGPTLISIHDYWKNQSFDYTDLCQQSNFSAF